MILDLNNFIMKTDSPIVFTVNILLLPMLILTFVLIKGFVHVFVKKQPDADEVKVKKPIDPHVWDKKEYRR